MSDQFQLDLSRQSREPMQEGVYTLVPVEVTLHQANSTSIRVVYYVPKADQFLSDFFGLSDRARWKLDQFLDLIGAPTSGKASLEQIREWTLSKAFEVGIRVEEYQGKRVNRIDRYVDCKPISQEQTVLQKTALERWIRINIKEDKVTPAENVLIETKQLVIEDILKQLGEQ